MAVSRSTLLRLIRGLPDPPVGLVTVLGVDEFALRRRHHYGTVLIDLAGGHRPVDVLIGREAEDFADWLRAHPGVEMICRDRAGAYADGAREGAPGAIQVADRWHLWDDLCRHLERLVAAHHACLPEPVVSAPDTPNPGVPRWPDTVRIEHTRQRYHQTHELLERGLSMRAIARKLDLNFKTVRRYLCADSVATLLAGGVRVSVLDSFKPYLHERLTVGVRNATVLHREIAEHGYTGGYVTLMRPFSRRCRRYRDAGGAAGRRLDHRSPRRLDPADGVRLRAIRTLSRTGRRNPPCSRVRPNDQGPFRRQGHTHQWMGAIDADLPALRSFTAGLRRELDAVVRRPHPWVQLRPGRGHREPHQTTQGGDVRTRETRPAPQAHTAGLNTAPGAGHCSSSVKHAT
jgi:hypothetical protein